MLDLAPLGLFARQFLPHTLATATLARIDCYYLAHEEIRKCDQEIASLREQDDRISRLIVKCRKHIESPEVCHE